jgi:MerR family transcriptional regulator, light-induced transcriptional regulator
VRDSANAETSSQSDQRRNLGYTDSDTQQSQAAACEKENSSNGNGSVETLDQLASIVAAQIIPRLIAVTLPPAPTRTRPCLATIAAHDIAEFTELILSDNTLAIHSYIELFRAKGISVEAIYLELLTGAARQLGTLWSDDECDFCEVSLATWRIQQLMYDLRPAFFAEELMSAPSGYRVLFAPLAAEQHTLGLMMAAEFFRRAGWDVSSALPSQNDDLIETVSGEYLDLIGISVSGEVILRDLPRTIAAVRAASLNRHITVMVGGWQFLQQPNLAVTLGADFSAPDIRDAIIRAEKHVLRAWDRGQMASLHHTFDTTNQPSIGT